MNKQESSPSPTFDGSDPSRKLFRRMPPPPVRMITRGVSGAVRPKSVDEILSSLDVSTKYINTTFKPLIPSLAKRRFAIIWRKERFTTTSQT